MGSGAASGNTINLESGHISSSQIIAGYTVSGEASDNTVNITGGVLNGTAALYGGYGTSSTGNTLNVYSKRFISHLRQNSPSVQQTQREQKTQAVLLSKMARLLMQKAL